MKYLILILFTLAAQADQLQELEKLYKTKQIELANAYLKKLKEYQFQVMKEGNLKEANRVDAKIKQLKAQFEVKKPEKVVDSKTLDAEGRWESPKGLTYIFRGKEAISFKGEKFDTKGTFLVSGDKIHIEWEKYGKRVYTLIPKEKYGKDAVLTSGGTLTFRVE